MESLLIYKNLRKVIYKFEPEMAHLLGENFMKVLERAPFAGAIWRSLNTVSDERLKQNLFNTTFNNPVGLGAGFDKNGTMIREIRSLGFGFTEIGTVTPLPQDGNPKPRLHRHIEEETIQNAMGFNNGGMENMRKRIEKLYPFKFPVGINIGKNKVTPEDKAIEDYLTLIENFEKFASYLVVNISSPNTPNLRDLQNEAFIGELFTKAKERTSKPILLKIAPDMSEESAIELSSFAVKSGASGIIATNTTIDYSLISSPRAFGGGLSGKVLREKSFKLFDALAEELYGKTTLISVGGVDSAEEAYRRLKAGASLVQVYSALVFKGPSLVKEINSGILKLMRRDGFGETSDVIGSDRK
jgi:dihydroorotate dehydrogenase